MQDEQKNNQIIDVLAPEKIVETKSKNPIYIRTVNIFVNPFKNRYAKHYKEKKHHLVIDGLFVIIILLLIVINIILIFKKFGVTSIMELPNRQEAVINGPCVALNHNFNKDYNALKPGEKSAYSFSITNTTKQNLEDLSVKLFLESGAVDYNSITSSGRVEELGIVWDENQSEALKVLMPGEKLDFDFSFQLKDDIKIKNPIISLQIKISGKTLEKDFIEMSNKEYIKVLSDLKIVPQARFVSDEGDQLGIGQWPPQVDKETVIRIFLKLQNNLNNINTVSVSATIASHISWQGNQAVDHGLPISVEENKIVWQVGDLPAGQNSEGSFWLKFTPDQDMIGQEILLLEDIRVIGRDNFVGEKIEFISNDLRVNSVVIE